MYILLYPRVLWVCSTNSPGRDRKDIEQHLNPDALEHRGGEKYSTDRMKPLGVTTITTITTIIAMISWSAEYPMCLPSCIDSGRIHPIKV